MLATLGDLIDDIVVALHSPIHVASDTEAAISHRRGGSAANVASSAAIGGQRVRFLGQVGDDPTADVLLDELRQSGVDVSLVRRSGTTGTIIVIVDAEGERTMLTDRRACLELADPEPSWLEGVSCLHVPLYSLVDAPIGATAQTLIGWAHERSIPVSIDASSTSLIASIGVAQVNRLLSELTPAVIFANEDEANMLGIAGPIGNALTVVKRGPKSALVFSNQGLAVEVPAIPVAAGSDTTAAGDAFAAGFLSNDADEPIWLDDPVGACERAHCAAASLMNGRLI